MTFYEAALRVLERSGAPLHAQEITKQAISSGLLSHIGKTPEVTMLARLSAMARRQRDRRLTVTAVDTFALTEWMLPEDTEALKATGIPVPNPEAVLPPLRPVERHPEVRSDFIRAAGRQGDRRRREEDGRRRRLPPVAELAFEVLSDAKVPLTAARLLAALQEREAVGDELGELALLEALAQDNQRRLSDGRRPHFTASKPAEDAPAEVALDVPADEVPPAVIQERFCRATGVKVQVEAIEPSRGGAEAGPTPPAVDGKAEDERLAHAVKQAARDAKRTAARDFRRRLGALGAGAIEKACVKLLHAHHFRELKVAKRGKEGPLFTARRRDGSLELRWAIRIVRGASAVERRHVVDLRRELGHAGAQAGLLLTPGDVKGEARSEAVAGGALVGLWGGEHLAEKFFEAGVGVSVTKVELYEADEGFFERMDEEAEVAAQRREERLREKGQSRRGGVPADEPSARSREAQATDAPPLAAGGAEDGTPIISIPASVLESIVGGADDDTDDDGPDDEGSAQEGSPEAGSAGVAGEGGRRKRRRRRRRRGVPGGAPAPGSDGQPAARAAAGAESAESAESSSAPETSSEGGAETRARDGVAAGSNGAVGGPVGPAAGSDAGAGAGSSTATPERQGDAEG